MPIWLIIWLAAWFAWLAYETDWMRIRLIVGAIPPVLEYPTKTWEELKPYPIKKTDQTWLRFPGIMSPLCGWDWLTKTQHIMPEYRIELVGESYRTTITSSNAQALKDAMRVNRNPWIHVKI